MSDPILASIHTDLLPYAVGIDTVSQHPRNPREHDEDVLRESLILNGQYAPILVQRSTGHIVAGNGTWAACKSLGWTHVAAVLLDLDDDQALRVLLRDNRSKQKSKNDPEALLALLRTLDGEFAGTGYGAQDFTGLLELVGGSEVTPPDPAGSPVGGSSQAQVLTGDLRSLTLAYPQAQFDALVRDLITLQEHEDETFTEVVQRVVLAAKSR